jgi:hypothetical protein
MEDCEALLKTRKRELEDAKDQNKRLKEVSFFPLAF